MRWSSASYLFFLCVLLLAVVANGVDSRKPGKRQLGDVLGPEADEDESPSASATGDNTPSPSATPTPSDDPTSSSSSSEEPTNSSSDSTSEEESTSSSTSEDEEPTSSTSEEEEAPSTTPPPEETSSEEDDEVTPSSSIVVITQSVTIGDSVVPQTSTSFMELPTEEPNLGEDDEGSESSGLSTNKRNIIIGVVVGVGGAIILGGLAVVIYRLRRKRNARGPDDDDLMHSGTAVGSHSHENSANSSPFKSTLDQYHNPGPVNPASNF